MGIMTSFIINGVETLGKTELLIFNRWELRFTKSKLRQSVGWLGRQGNPFLKAPIFIYLNLKRCAQKGLAIIRDKIPEK
jgi:hypothetical protein